MNLPDGLRRTWSVPLPKPLDVSNRSQEDTRQSHTYRLDLALGSRSARSDSHRCGI